MGAHNDPASLSYDLYRDASSNANDVASNYSHAGANEEAAPLPTSNPTISFWNARPADNPLAREGAFPSDSLPEASRHADVVIIGSGITGVSFAYHFSKLIRGRGQNHDLGASEERESVKIVLLDARDFCSGATGRNGGHLTASLFGGFKGRSEKYGVLEAKRAVQLQQYNTAEILDILHSHEGWADEVDLVEGGNNAVFFTDAEEKSFRDDFEAARQAGVDLSRVEWLDRDEALRKFGTRFPLVRLPGHNLWPLKLVTKLYRLAESPLSSTVQHDPVSLRLHTHTSVHSVTAIEGQTPSTPPQDVRWAVNTSRGTIQTRYVIHATNAYVSHLLPQFSGRENGVVPTRGQVMAIHSVLPRSEILMTKSGWAANNDFEYWFTRPEKNPAAVSAPDPDAKEPNARVLSDRAAGRALVILGGGRDTASPNFESGIADDGVVNEGISQVLRRFLARTFEEGFDSKTEPAMEWTGIMGFTKTGDPYVGPVPIGSISEEKSNFLSGQYIAAGYTGHGMPRAFACAEAVAGMVYADMLGTKWQRPGWMPDFYLTNFVTRYLD